jgi:hypothetical protein
MTTGDAVKIVNAVRPRLVVLTHFGMKMIFRSPAREAKRVERETGVKAVAARDGLELLVGEEILVGKVETGEKRERVVLDKFGMQFIRDA